MKLVSVGKVTFQELLMSFVPKFDRFDVTGMWACVKVVREWETKAILSDTRLDLKKKKKPSSSSQFTKLCLINWGFSAGFGSTHAIYMTFNLRDPSASVARFPSFIFGCWEMFCICFVPGSLCCSKSLQALRISYIGVWSKIKRTNWLVWGRMSGTWPIIIVYLDLDFEL